MAEHTVTTQHTLIDRYISALADEMKRVRGVEEILEEVADHLMEAVAVQARRGHDLTTAQRNALAEFGDPCLVGRAFASTTTGGIAVATTFTRRAGVALTISSILWLVAIGLMYWSDVLDRTRPWEGSPQAVFTVATIVLLLAGITLVIGVLGLTRRHGGTLGLAGRLALWLAALTAAASVASWAWGVWLTPLAAGAVALAIGLRRGGMAPPVGGVLIGVGGVAAVLTAWAFEFTKGDVELGQGAFTASVFAALAVYCLGLSLLGGWLRAEQPADETESMAIA